ncbi:MAG: amino acid adenylation domain-containing protein [Ignavibacteria bacterium]|jgi:amino acid adenylation domain-containing protein|nr:amino acid adenylation domain-containing protein [Ignavibacteria bacterium]
MNNIEDIYPLSPMQKGMLFHSLLSSETGVYIEQTSCTFQGKMDISAFKYAWEKVVERHSILRSAYVWEDVDEPLQIVFKSVELPFKVFDWQNIADKKVRLEETLRQEVEEGFDLETAPLMKLVMIKADAETHYFVWTQHHVLFDGWSAQIIIKEVFEIYNALINKSSIQLNAARPFRDYISWLQRQDIHKAEEYWRNLLRGLSGTTSLRPHASQKKDGAYFRKRVDIDKEISVAALAFCRNNRLTVNTLFQGLWAFIQGVYTGQDDILFGSTVSGRPAELPDINSTVGLFINTLPVRIKIDHEMNVADWLRDIQIQQAEQRKYEYCSLTDIHGWSQIPREVPLFESIIVFENYPVSAALSAQKGSIEIKDVKSHTRTNYPLTIAIGAAGEEISIEMAFDESYFDHDDIEALFLRFKVLLSEISTIAEKKLKEISVLSDVEENRILREFSQGKQLSLEYSSIPECFEAVAAMYGDLTACYKDGVELSYKELNSKADLLARLLRSKGIVREEVIGVMAERSIEMVTGIMGCLKSSGAFLPIDPYYPEERISYMLEDSKAGLILTQSRLLDKVPASWLDKVVLLDSEEAYSHEESNGEVKPCPELKSYPEVIIYPESLAYLIYTSGSTGKPKGTMLSHRGVVNLSQVQREAFRLFPGERILQFSSLSFDASVWEIFMALLNGATLYLCSRDTVVSGEKLRDYLKSNRINILTVPPSVLSYLPDELSLPDLEVLVTAGEATSWSLFEKWGHGRRYFNAYGPTEATVCTTLQECRTEQKSGNSQTPPIGRAISNVRTYVLDDRMQPVPVGVAGELYIAGSGLARGYLGKPDLTSEKFLPDPFSSEKGSRLYRTGDWVRYLKDGEIEFLGRMDRQVKLRGFRIELQEIESQIMAFPGISQAAVLLKEDKTHERSFLVAYLETKDEEFDSSRLQQFLKWKLPEYMLPSSFTRLEVMPLTTSGKIDRKSLPFPVINQEAVQEKRRKSVTEEILANIWADILKLENVNPGDNFFELGGHSLLATQLISRIRDAFGVEIPFSILFEEKKLSEMAGRIDRIVRQDKEIPDKPVKCEVTGSIPLSFPQQRLWFLDKLQPGMTSYNIPSAIKLRGEINAGLLCEAVDIVSMRHQVLRTVFREIDGQPVQAIKDNYRTDIKIVNIKGETEENKSEEVNGIMDAEISRPFDLKEGPLFRIHILILSKDECIVLFVIHHIIADGWSIAILIHEIAAAYEALIKKKNLSLPELNLQYSDYSIWQKKMYEQGKFGAQLNYWKEKLSNVPQVIGLQTDYPRKPILSTSGNTITDILEEPLLKELLALSRKEGATLFMTLLAAFNVLLHKYSGQNIISVGAPVAGRVRTEIENLIGFFVNNIVLITEFERGMTFKDLLKKVRTVSLEAYANQDVPFEKVVEAIAPVRDLSRSPLFQVMFVFQNFQARESAPEDLKISYYPLRSQASNFDLSMVLNESEEGLLMAAEYNSDLFKAETIEGMISHYKNIISSVLADPEINIDDLKVLSPAEEDKILNRWNHTAKQYSSSNLITGRFDEIVKENPDADSVIMATSQGEITGKLTYSDLNFRADRLALFLRSKGIVREEVIGVMAERSIEMVTGIMGCLKSSGAFLPIDPYYPEERISYMLEDSKAGLILTQSRLLDKVPASWLDKVVLLDSEEAYSHEESNGEVKPCPELKSYPEVIIYPESLAYLIYTSGSTGKPKGTMLSHRGVVNLSQVQREAFRLFPGERILQFSSLSFDASVWEIFMALLNGATLYLCSRDTVVSGEKLRDYLKSNRINILTVPPSVLSYLPDELSLPDLEVLVTAGEATSWSLFEKWGHGRRYFNAYGPTEATVCTTLQECRTEQKSGNSQTPPIGRAISNVRTYVLDDRMQPVPVGVAGELYIAGSGLARGYLGKPDLTSEKFLPDPFSSEKGSRLYRTGDWVRYLKDGEIEFLGRMDRQVKLRGFRIELQEIESQIMAFPGISQAAVLLKEDKTHERSFLVAYLETKDEEFDSSRLQQFLKWKLPEYMLPSSFTRLEVMPLTTSGKIDRKALDGMDMAVKANNSEYVEPRTKVEKEVAEITKELLKADRVGMCDNFFELGGHSLLASQFVSRIREAAGIEVPLRLVFEKPILADLSLEIELLGKGNGGKKDEAIKSVSRDSYRIMKSDLMK